MRISSLLCILVLSAACADDEGTGDATEYRALVRGRLVGEGGNNSEASRLQHDTAILDLRDQAIAADLQTHIAFTALAEPTDYMALDVWTDLDALRAYYDDPAVAGAWAELFEAAPTVDIYRHPSEWVEWGTVTRSGQGIPPAFFFHLRNRLRLDDEEQNRLTHNRVAGGASQDHAISLGDIGHSANLRIDDAQELLFIDFWQDLAGADEFFSDPVTQAGGAELFDTPFDVTVYAPTDWHQFTRNQDESGPIDGTWTVASLECDGVAQQIPLLTVQIFNTRGSFVVDVPSTCTASITETYAYPDASSILITPTASSCAPSATACAPAFGGSTACPTPPAVEFEFALTPGQLTFTRTSVGPPVDSCPAGQTVLYTMSRK